MNKTGIIFTGALAVVWFLSALTIHETRYLRPKTTQYKTIPIAATSEEPCRGHGYFSTDNRTGTYLCVDRDGPRIVNNVPVKTVLEEMIKREANAWEQLRVISELRDDLSAQVNRAHESRAEYGRSPRAADIRTVIVAQTADIKPVWVIKLYTADGVASTLWLDGQGEGKNLRVRSVSPY